ncbi:MAG TPA: hypothetical protein PKJ15_05045 [Methanomassiliicoccales archaeon]|nr:hypothetical protein [Methanomassiliicoccales archaeon]
MDTGPIPNPSNRNEFIKAIAAFSFMLALCMVFAMISKIPWFFLSIMPILAFVVFYFIGWEPQYISRPHHVEILDDGIVLHMRYGKGKKFVRYQDILWVSLPAMDPITNEPIYPDGYIGLGSRFGDAHHINYSLVVQIRDRYHSKFRESLPKAYAEWLQKEQGAQADPALRQREH